MPNQIDSNTECIVRALSEENYSSRAIKNKLQANDIDISIQSICYILNYIGISRKALNSNEPELKKQNMPISRILNNIRKIKKNLAKESKSNRNGRKR
jgi:hypothetical protein